MEKDLKILGELKKGNLNDTSDYSRFEKAELTPRFSNVKSFYKKAFVIFFSDNLILLQSYETIVAGVLNGKYLSFGKYSSTTSRHQKEFEKQFAN